MPEKEDKQIMESMGRLLVAFMAFITGLAFFLNGLALGEYHWCLGGFLLFYFTVAHIEPLGRWVTLIVCYKPQSAKEPQ